MCFKKNALKYAPSSTPMAHRHILKIAKSSAVNFLTAFIIELYIIENLKFNNKMKIDVKTIIMQNKNVLNS